MEQVSLTVYNTECLFTAESDVVKSVDKFHVTLSPSFTDMCCIIQSMAIANTKDNGRQDKSYSGNHPRHIGFTR